MKKIERGDVYWCHLSPVVGSEQSGTRPVVVVQNNVGNEYSPTVVVVPMTTQKVHNRQPTHVLTYEVLGHANIVLCEQIRTVDVRYRRFEYITTLSEETMKYIDKAIKVELGLEDQ